MANDKEQTDAASTDQAKPDTQSGTDGAPPVDPAAAAQLTADRDAALAKLEEQAAALSEAEAKIAGLTEQLATAQAACADLEAVTADRDAKAKELETATAVADDLRAQLAAATKMASVSKKAKPPKLRAAAPMKDGLSGDALIAALKDGAHEIVFSNGTTEIDVLEPLQVAGPAWQKAAGGVVLTTPVTIKPDRRVTIAGFALLDAKGKQIAWAAMRVPAMVQANQEMRLDRQIVFA